MRDAIGVKRKGSKNVGELKSRAVNDCEFFAAIPQIIKPEIRLAGDLRMTYRHWHRTREYIRFSGADGTGRRGKERKGEEEATVGGCWLAEKGIRTRAWRDEGSRPKRGGSRCSSGPCCKCRLCSSLICVRART